MTECMWFVTQVVPFVHVGMQNIMPRGRKLPATGQKVTVVVGEPIDLGPVLRRCENAKAGHVGESCLGMPERCKQHVFEEPMLER